MISFNAFFFQLNFKADLKNKVSYHHKMISKHS